MLLDLGFKSWQEQEIYFLLLDNQAKSAAIHPSFCWVRSSFVVGVGVVKPVKV